MMQKRTAHRTVLVRVIGVEPTRREALAPETSVSTISPHAHWKSVTKIQNLF